MALPRWSLLMALVALGSLVAASCGDGDGDAADEIVSTVARRAADAPSAAPLAGALDRFGGELYAAVTAGNDDQNVAVSAYSVAAALALTRAGARGVTRDEIDRALHLASIDADAGFNALDQALAARDTTRKTADGKTLSLTLSTANAVWGQRDFPIEQAFLDVLAEHYGAGMHVVDFAADTEGARRAINGWVSERTRAKIPELIKPDVLDPLVRMVLTNALYLKASWAFPFDSKATADATFSRLDGSTTTAPTMHQTEALGYAQGAGWRAVELPYVGNELAMIVVLPDAGRFAAIEQSLAQGLQPFAAAMKPAQVRLALPRFTFRTATELSPVLKALGIVALFDPELADLSGITTADRLFVSDVIHEAYLAVTEEGTEAAAATAVVARVTSAPAEPQEVTVDRPFLFAIRDRATGAVLMQGRVLDPTAS